ncbi:hypothetical protein, conserved [Babesia bigemina]|uniref:Uncharacterized protein n=1 Tax=Babesia bigemina TaxID=5866 RepID=A0A061D5D3_BABBI|nr:hypothetical protein, conserved [Babesia bigemina]CDR95916.1 hypothetical protein, conserved [Babesia bigemina]|eukprot:XP_012768102.1 hypothetical protein, conserved [Babesia bigemina]
MTHEQHMTGSAGSATAATSGASATTRESRRLVTRRQMLALCVSAATVLGLSVFAEEFFSHFKGVGEEDDDDVHVGRTNERRVAAYFNPATSRWERIVPPFVPPAPAELLRHYGDLDDDDFDEAQVAAALPKREFVVMERPFSQTYRPTLLYDTRSGKLVVFRD